MIAKKRMVEDQGYIRRNAEAAPILAQLHSQKDPDAELTKRFIRQQFARKYAASIVSFMPYLISINGKDGVIKSAAGYRPASEENLYLEQYFSDPVEQILSAKVDMDISRELIVEVGNLACVCNGYARIVIAQLTQILHYAGFQWVVFTLTKELQNSFKKLGLAPQIIGMANAQLIKSEDNWGSYYETSPTVMFGNIQAGYQRLFNGGQA